VHLKLKNWKNVKILNWLTFSVGSGLGGYEKCSFNLFIKCRPSGDKFTSEEWKNVSSTVRGL
jgi:hypothetical protein